MALCEAAPCEAALCVAALCVAAPCAMLRCVQLHQWSHAAFTMWLAGAGVKSGGFGETDPMGYRAIKDKVSVYDLQATILDSLGLHHKKLNYPFQGLNQTLTPVNKPARVMHELFS